MKRVFRRLKRIYYNLSLKNKFIIPTITVIFLSFLSVGIYFIHDQRAKLEARLQEKADRIAYLLLSSNIESIWDVDLKTLERNCRAFFEDEEITRLVIIDTFYGDEALIDWSKNISGTRDIVKTSDFIKGGQKVAKLEVVISNYFIDRNLTQMKYTLLILSALVFFLMIGIIRIVSQIAFKPLKAMMSGVQHLREGDLKFRIVLQSQDELGKLAGSFNTMAEELSLYHGHLQELVERRTDELETANVMLRRENLERERAEVLLLQAKDAAETASRAKSEFLANMSHELRTPLNAILGFSELMRRDPGMSPSQRTHLATIGRSGEHLLSLINDVLELSKIEAGRIVLNECRFDLHHLLLGLEEMFRLRIHNQGLSLAFEREGEVPRYVQADQNKLRQVLINLLDNAVKFTEKGGITLRVAVKAPVRPPKSDDCVLTFEVIDTGIGISLNERKYIFDAFFQTKDPHLPQQGTGLGLPISQKFVKLMGGVLTVSSELNRSTRFTFDLPVKPAGGADKDTSRLKRRVCGLAECQPVLRLLVVEDNDNNRNLLVSLLRTVGFEVQEAVDGREAVKRWQQWQPHQIWMDMRMPVMDGYEATRRIRKREQKRKAESAKLKAGSSKLKADSSKFNAESCRSAVSPGGLNAQRKRNRFNIQNPKFQIRNQRGFHHCPFCQCF